jgi:hypothetical protein
MCSTIRVVGPGVAPVYECYRGRACESYTYSYTFFVSFVGLSRTLLCIQLPNTSFSKLDKPLSILLLG